MKSNWKEIKNSVLERDEYKCLKCGKLDKKNHVHHVIPRRHKGLDVEDNLVTLCRNCHKTEENRYIRYGITNFTIFPKDKNGITKEDLKAFM